jgi:hypothetical protein
MPRLPRNPGRDAHFREGLATPMSHVNVLPNEQEAYPGDGAPHGSTLHFKEMKNWRDKPFSDASGEVKYKDSGRHEYQEAEVRMRGAIGVSRDDHETANAARQDAYNDASSDAVNKRKEITKKGMDDMDYRNKLRAKNLGKPEVIKINTDPAKGK